jgi:protein ImuB
MAAPHIAALWAIDFPLQAMVRANPERREEALAVIEGRTLNGGSRILVVSSPVRRSGARPGMTVAQARALAPAARFVLRDHTLEVSARAALVDVARSFSPHIEVGRGDDLGWIYLDVSGLEHLVGPPDTQARALQRAARAVGLEVNVALARSKSLARIAARTGTEPRVVPAHRRAERELVGRLPLEALEPEPRLLEQLRRFGLESVDDFLELPRRRVAERLGPEGVLLHRRARGDERDGGLQVDEPPATFVEEQSLDFALDNLDPLASLLHSMLDRLVRRLTLRGFLAGNLHLSLDYEGAGSCERIVEINAPSRDVGALLALCRLSLARSPPERAVVRVVVSVMPAASRERQLSLFEPAGPAPDRLAVTVARLQALCGDGRVGAPRPADSYEEDAFELNPFSGDGATTKEPPPAVPVALRRFRPPQPVEVLYTQERLTRLESREINGRVTAVRGPFRRDPGWWHDDEQHGFDFFDVRLETGTAYRICRQREQWWVLGWYD